MQVLIEGKVVEASEQFSREFGVRWGFTGREINLGGDLALQRNNLTISPGGVKTGSPFGYNLRLGTLDVLGDLDAALSLAERETEVRIVSSPRVVTMNNKEANISQETNIFIPTPQPTVGGATPLLTYEKERIPLSLKVKPQITNGGDVIMEVNLTRSFVGVRTDGIPPDVNQRAATTNVMVRNGQTAVIGGVYQSDVSETENGVPWLRKIPILGWLFKSKTFSSEKNELLLFLTPRILGQGNSDNSAKEAQL
jgi:type IV pilus assembly protein PilQ